MKQAYCPSDTEHSGRLLMSRAAPPIGSLAERLNGRKTVFETPFFRRVLISSLSVGLIACGADADNTHQTSAQADEVLVAQKAVPEGGGNAAAVGNWSALADWPLVAIHSALLPDGRVVSYGTDGRGIQTGYFIYDVWSPTHGLGADAHLTLENKTGTDLFCSAQLLLPQSGNLLITAGDQLTRGVANTSQSVGNADVNLFNTSSSTLTALPETLNRIRWYPTMTTLADGRILVQGGASSNYGNKRPQITPEIYTPGRGFNLLTGASSDLAYGVALNRWWYPRAWVAPNSQVFSITADQMFYVDPDGLGSLASAGAFTGPNNGATSTAVMYRPGLILQAGGGDHSNVGSGRAGSTAASIIDIRGGQPAVRSTEAMKLGRHWATSTVLADGTVLVTGGALANNQLNGVATTPELWDPNTGTWKNMASTNAPRLYHSTALMLPDASVLIAGGGSPGPVDQLNAEIFYPPFLYTESGQAAERPVIDSAPETAVWNEAIQLELRGNASVSRVTMVRTGSVTHSFNMEQRFIELPFAQDSTGGLTVFMPAERTTAPPGYYMVFVFDQAGVPAIARIVRMWDETVTSAADQTEVDYTAGLADGGFETIPAAPQNGFTTYGVGQSIGQWRVTAGTIDQLDYDALGAGIGGSEGSQLIELNGNQAGEISQLLTGLVPGHRYALSLVYSRHPSAQSVSARIRIAQTDRTWVSTNSGALDGWYNLRLAFTASETSHTLVLNGAGSGGLGMLIDDVVVSPMGKELLVDGDFETGSNPAEGGYLPLRTGDRRGAWTVSSGTVDVHDNAHWNSGAGTQTPSAFATGRRHVDLNGSSYGALSQNVGGLVAGQRYLVSTRYALHPWAQNGDFRIDIAGKSKTTTVSNKGNLRWAKTSMVFTAAAAEHELRLAGTSGNPHLGVLIDDVSLIALPALVQVPDGGFEQSAAAPEGGWTTYGAGSVLGGWRVTSGNVDVHSNSHRNLGAGAQGRQHVDLNGSVPGEITQTIVGLMAGQRYAVSFDYSLHELATSGAVRVRMADLDRQLSVSRLPAGEWHQASFEFTATTANHALTLTGSGPVPYAGVLVDRIKVSREVGKTRR